MRTAEGHPIGTAINFSGRIEERNVDANDDCGFALYAGESISAGATTTRSQALAHTAFADRRKDEAVGSQGLNSRAFARASAFIESHLGESFTLSDLARAACVSRFHFARLFRVSTGLSPMEYVLKMRIERAKCALAEGRQKISVAAAEFGFFDQSHFARTFRRMTGVSPTEFMRTHR